MNPILITGGIKNLKNRRFGKNSKTGEKSAENFLPKISPEKTFSSSSKRRTFPEEKPLFSTERFISSKEKTSRRKSRIPEREIAKALLKWFKKTPPFFKKSLGVFCFGYSEKSSESAFPKSYAEYCASERVFPVAPISIRSKPGERSMLYFR